MGNPYAYAHWLKIKNDPVKYKAKMEKAREYERRPEIKERRNAQQRAARLERKLRQMAHQSEGLEKKQGRKLTPEQAFAAYGYHKRTQRRRRDTWTKKEEKFICLNGYYDFRTGSVKPFDVPRPKLPKNEAK